MSAYYHMDLESFAIAPKTGSTVCSRSNKCLTFLEHFLASLNSLILEDVQQCYHPNLISGHLASRAYKNLGRNQMLWDAGLPLKAMDNITAVQAKVSKIKFGEKVKVMEMAMVSL